ncbi:MAG: ROK family protein [Spirochaetales bacterium]|nr:ROK family protein [Spirochaetales bacterium]
MLTPPHRQAILLRKPAHGGGRKGTITDRNSAAKPILARSDRRLQVLNLLRELGEASRLELVEELGIDKKTVSTLVADLLARSLLVTAGSRESRAGRRREILKVNGAHSNFLGLDLGATHIIGLLTDLNGEVLDRVFFEIRPELPVELILEQMQTICRSLVASSKATAEVQAIGICVPGFVNPETGVSLVAENIPGWREIRIREIFWAEFRRPIYLEDCSRAFGVAERWLGEARHADDFLALDLGHGIGMAIFLDGQVLTGAGYKAGEIGHIVVDPDGPPCTCGRRGCLETLASGRGIARQAAAGLAEGRSELLGRLTHGKIDSLTAQDVAIAASMNDTFSTMLLRRAGAHIGAALANAANLLNPSLIVLGGGLMNAGKVLLDAVDEALRRCTMMGIIDDLELRVSRLGVDASALGSALIAMDHVFAP